MICVEKFFPVYKHLLKNVKELGFDNIEIVIKDAFRWVEKSAIKADIIFADPPFSNKGVIDLPKSILEKGLINPGGCLVIEHASAINFEEIHEFSFTKNYGAVNFSFFFVD